MTRRPATLAFAAVAVVTVASSTLLHPLATASAVLLAAALVPTVDRTRIAVALIVLVCVQDAGLRIDATPPATHGHEHHHR